MYRIRVLLCTSLAAGAVLATHGSSAQEPVAGDLEVYRALRQATLAAAGRIRGQSLSIDRFELAFEDGHLFLNTPVEGISTGALFLGKGRIRMDPPDAVERQQLRKYLDNDRVDLEFKSLFLRFSGDTGTRLAALVSAAGDSGDLRKAQRRYEEHGRDLLEERLFNADSRIVQDLLTEPDPEPGYFFADVEAKGGFSIEIDPDNVEEVRVYRAWDLDRSWNHWSGFHRLDDYGTETTATTALGAPGPVADNWRPAATVPTVSTDLSIDTDGNVRGTVGLRVRTLRPTRVLRLTISSLLEVHEVRLRDPALEVPDPARGAEPRAAAGRPVAFVQEPIGRGMREDRYEPRITVILPETVAAGSEFGIDVSYSGELLQRLQNREYVNRDTDFWYPQHPHTRRSRFDMTFRTDAEHRAATGGELIDSMEVDGTWIERRHVDRDVIGMSFHYGKFDIDAHPDGDGVPITIYSSPYSTGFDPGNRERTLADIHGSIRIFERYFGVAPFDSLTVTETPLLGGQSFQGFLMFSYLTFAGMHTGEAEFFRAHEIAHQWWGNAVTWDSYHEHWISEGFAQYAAALYALEGLEDPDQFDDMLGAWRKDVLGRVDVRQGLGLRSYGLPPEVLRDSDGTESGAVWLGYRLSSDETPPDYRILVYEKGAFVLHMLRMMLYDWDNASDARFRDLLRGFFEQHRGGHVSTADFRAAAEAAYGAPLDWFFDQWVFGTDVPRYRDNLRGRNVAGAWRLQGSIRQDQAPAGFRMPVPVRVRYRDDSEQVFVIEVDRAEVPVDLALRSEPDEIDVNPGHAVLAR